MTVTSTRTIKTTPGNGATTVFPYDFLIPLATDVAVYYTNTASGVRTDLNTSQYSITGLGDPAGGTVTYAPTTPLAAGNVFAIERIIPLTQSSAVPSQGNLFASAIETILDRLTMMVQQIDTAMDRAIVAPNSDSALSALPNATLRANMALIFDALGNPAVGAYPTTPVSGAMAPVVNAATLSAAIVALFTASTRIGSAKVLTGTATVDLASTASGRFTSSTIPVVGAVVGDIVLGVTASGNATTAGGFLIGQVTANDVVTFYYMNGTAAAIDPASQNYTAQVLDISTLV